MKTKILLTTVSTFFILHSAFAQGALTPPGAPAPTMKTLAQIEPRSPIAALPFNITQPGSYYLTTNLTQAVNGGGIFITSGNVTLDLNGFALLGANSGTTNGITLSGSIGNITVRNGTIAGWGGAGVDGFTLAPNSVNELFERLTVTGNSSSGILAGPASLIRDCLSSVNLGSGNTAGLATRGGEIRNCVVLANTPYGIYVSPGVVTGCVVQNNVRSGIYVNQPNSVVQQNTCTGNNAGFFANQAGIYINDSNNRVEGNYVTTPNATPGIIVNSPTYTNNVVIKNVVFGNGANNYVGTAGNDFGPIGTAATATSPWANISH